MHARGRWLLWASWAAWVVHELLAVPKGGARRADPSDAGTIGLNAAMFVVANVGAPALTLTQPSSTTRRSHAPLAAAWLGIALRRWSITTLGRWFRRDVAVREAQPVIDHGPYRIVRHPAYTGALLVQAGLGAATGRAAAFLVSVVPPSLGYVKRVRVEERFLTGSLPGYGAYVASHRWRLLPGVW